MTQKKRKVCLLGASFETGNMGVSALSEASIKCIVNKWPNTEIILLGTDTEPGENFLYLKSRKVVLRKVPVRFNKNILLPYHFFSFLTYAILLKIIRVKRFRKFCLERNKFIKEIIESEIFMDITGGDSFSDIYGMKRFTFGFLRKCLAFLYSKNLLLLPQTYGPFNSVLAKLMARYILKQSIKIHSRDIESIQYVKEMMGNKFVGERLKFTPDVAFVLDARSPDNQEIVKIFKSRKKNSIFIGFNISGLLYSGGYTQDNMFNLSQDYPKLISAVIKYLLLKKNIVILLIPHVITDYKTESDTFACREVYKNFSSNFGDRIFSLENSYNHNELKYIIGKCDVMIGSRMHACIAALSQFIPAIALAYSKKFYGVFKSVGAEEQIIDLRSCTKEEIINVIESTIINCNKISGYLKKNVPLVQKKIITLFDEF